MPGSSFHSTVLSCHFQSRERFMCHVLARPPFSLNRPELLLPLGVIKRPYRTYVPASETSNL